MFAKPTQFFLLYLKRVVDSKAKSRKSRVLNIRTIEAISYGEIKGTRTSQ